MNSLASGGPCDPGAGRRDRELRRMWHRLEQAAEAHAAWRAAGHPPLERFLTAWTARRPAMGARDRRFLSHVLFRLAREADALLTRAHPRPPRTADDPLVLAAGALGIAEEETPTAEGETVRTVVEDILLALPDRPWGRLPSAWREALLRSFDAREAEDLAAALNRPVSTYDLRVNAARLEREEALAVLAEEGVAVVPTPYAPHGLRLTAGGNLRAHRFYREGLVEIQDESSQIVSLLALPPRSGRVLDFCAGAGGKTLALAAELGDGGEVTGYDPDPSRLAELRRRLRRAAVPAERVRVRETPPDDLYEVVLVDAPCGGSGTLRRAPHLLWRPLDLETRAARQRTILREAARRVRPGGILIYATCSVFAEENADVAAAFMDEDARWRPLDPRPRLEAAGVRDCEALVAGAALRLLPHRHGTDGMEARLWLRTGG